MKEIKLLGIPLNTGTYTEFVSEIVEMAETRKNHYACIANVHMLMEAYKDSGFAKIIANAGVITPDGRPITWALRLLYGIRQQRVAGMDLLPDLLQQASLKKVPVYFYGGQTELVNKTSAHVYKHYPDLVVAGLHSPPFRRLTETEEQEIVDNINNSGARLVFVILGCPKQERWMAAMNGRVHAAMVGVGGALPVMVGLQKRAPDWMQQYGLEWAFRLLQEPSRLFKRYAVTNSMFLYLLLKAYVHHRLLKRTI